MLPVVIFPLLSSLLLPLQAPRAELESFARRVAAPLVEHEGVPGISIAVLQDGELVLALALGFADERLALPMQTSTGFPIGSLGRSLSGAAALLELERAKHPLESPLGKLAADLPPALQPITLAQLFAGTSGLPASTALFARLAERTSRERLSRKEFLELLAALPAQGAPGESFADDSTAALLVPLLVEELGARSFATCVAEDLAGPLGLADTRVLREIEGTLGHAADCREVLGGRTLELWSGMEPSESWAHLVSTPSDLVRWQMALHQNALLSPAAARLLTESARDRSGELFGKNACFEIGTLGPEPRWRHVGGIAGWRGAMAWYGNARLGVCVLANCTSARVGEVEEDIARFVLRLPPRTPQDLALDPGESLALCGDYMLGTLRVRIFERDGKLFYESASEPTFRLRSQGFRRFLSASGEVQLVFSAETPKAASFDETRKGSTSIARRMD